jgi:serine/threonine protein kinase
LSEKDDNNVTTSDIGPIRWMSPEAIIHRTYSQLSDVWAFGVTIFEIVTQEDPYKGIYGTTSSNLT